MIYQPKKCPICFGLGAFGDHWSLLIIRDMLCYGSTRFQEFLEAGEGISTNILADRLRRLEEQQIISREQNPDNRRQILYKPTQKGRDLLPVLLTMIDWGEKYDDETVVPPQLAKRIRADLPSVSNEMANRIEDGLPGFSDELLLQAKEPNALK